MKAIILAADQGIRIRSAHREHPKCLIRFNNTAWTILDQQIHSLLVEGVREIGIVVGSEKDQIVRHVTHNQSRALGRFKFIENARFAETNNIYALWLARDWLKRDSFVALNADVAFDPRILPAALASTAPITMIVDRAWRDKTTKVIFRKNRIIRLGKQISPKDFSATYIGVTVFDSSIVDSLFSKIGHLTCDGKKQVFFSGVVQQLVDEGIHVGYTETKGRIWAKIVDAGDLAFARLYVFPKLPTADAAA